MTWHSKKCWVRRVREWKRPVDARRGRWVGKWGVYGGGKMTWHSKKSRVRRVREGKRPFSARRGRWDGKWVERTLTGSFSLFESVWGWKGMLPGNKKV